MSTVELHRVLTFQHVDEPVRRRQHRRILTLFFVHDRLVYIDSDGESQPILATRWRESDGGRTLEVERRPDLSVVEGARAVDASDELFRNPAHEFTRTLLAAVSGKNALEDTWRAERVL